MTSKELLTYLRQHNVHLWVEGDRLKYKGSQDVMTPAVLDEIRLYKGEIITYLHELEVQPNSTLTEPSPPPASGEHRHLAYKFVGHSGLKVSEFALGPYSSTMLNPSADEGLTDLMDSYIAAGGNCIDLSNVYTQIEKQVGKWLKTKNRDELIITSKAGLKVGEGPNDMGLSRHHIFKSIEKSLQDLGTEYLDIYYAHIWDGGTPLDETIAALDDLVRAGKVRYLGLSNFTGWQLQKAVDIAKYTNKERFICLQAQYNLLDRYPEWEQIPVCKNEGLGLFAWGSLSAGWLTGRYTRGMSSSDVGERVSFEGGFGMKHNSFEFKNNDRSWKTIDVLMEVAKEVERSPAQVALNWLKNRPGVFPILGPRNTKQLQEALSATGWNLTDEQESRLSQASALPPIMPHMFIQAANPPDRL